MNMLMWAAIDFGLIVTPQPQPQPEPPTETVLEYGRWQCGDAEYAGWNYPEIVTSCDPLHGDWVCVTPDGFEFTYGGRWYRWVDEQCDQ